MKELIEYLVKNKIQFTEIDDDFININNERYFLIKPDEEGKLFSEKFTLMTMEQDCDKYVYCFGDVWYYENKEGLEKVKLIPFRYIGVSQSEIKTDHFLGIRGPYEVLNGSALYSSWVNKARFLGCISLGICEKNSLAGTLRFQLECQKNKIKPIIGATYTIFRKRDDFKYDIKVYVKDSVGWENILLINKEVNVVNSGFIKEERFLELLEGLFLVVDPKALDFDKLGILLKKFDYYQLDTVEYISDSRDSYYLENLKKFVRSKFQPVSITDAFYLEKDHSYIKKILNGISEKREYESGNQYFKDKEDYYTELESLFSIEDDSLYDIYIKAVENEKFISNNCNFLIDLSGRHLPRYEMTEEQSKKFETNEDLFWYLIDDGFRRKVSTEDFDVYAERVGLEFDVIKLGDVIDYFLILWDIVQWCKTQNILTGVGRGSSGGSIIAYLLDVTQIDSIKFGLLFERFLNVGRVKKSLPDIDVDFEDERKEEVKHYMERRYGVSQVCSVGTYTTFKLKSAIKDLSKQFGVDFQETNYITSILDDGADGRFSKGDVLTLFKDAATKTVLKNFVQKNPEVINSISLVSLQPKAQSIHPCATLILPKEKDVFRWIPVRKMTSTDGSDTLVSEWEGGELESAGFLKEDILGIRQLTKFSKTLALIKEQTGREIDIYNLPLNDHRVIKYFQKGWNGDVFHFGSKGLTGYCKLLLPESIEDLIASISLFRPGAMESNAHNDYVLLKEGKKEPVYDFGLKSVTENTYGLYVYQEQIMKACQVLSNFTLVEADDIRKALGKMDPKLIESWRGRFIERAVSNGCPEKEAGEIWEKLARFAGYGFNRSHAAAYSVTGYISQWLKVHYPIYFWSVAFSYSSETDVMDYISEINLTGDIDIKPVDINRSQKDVYTDFGTRTIYWPLSSVRQVGDVATSQIMEVRNKDGQYFSFEEFVDRNKFKGGKVGKAVVENLVMSGAFDDIEKISLPRSRYNLINQYRRINKIKPDVEKDIFELNKSSLQEDWFWTLQQKRLSGIAFFNYKDLVNRYLDTDDEMISIENFQLEGSVRKKVKIGGYLVEFEEKSSKKGKWARMRLESNYTFINVTVWSEQYKQIEKLNLAERTKSLLLISGQIVWDSYKKENVLQTTDDSELIILE